MRDITPSRRLWCEGLGLPVAGKWPSQLSVRGGTRDVPLDATGEFKGGPPEIGLPLSRSELEGTLSRLESVGVKPLRGPKDFNGPLGYEVAVRDPDGVIVVLFAGRSA